MRIELDMPKDLEVQMRTLVIKATKEAFELTTQKNQYNEWMDLKTGASYADVSYSTFIKFRNMGLQICEIDGIKRVSKTEIDRFLKENSF